MDCPYCLKDTRVLETRRTSSGGALTRRRRCLACRQAFTTVERLDAQTTAGGLLVQGRDGTIEPLNLSRIRDSIRHVSANSTKAVPEEVVDSIVARVSERASLLGTDKKAISAAEVGAIILEELTNNRSIYAVTRIRYALGLKAHVTRETGFGSVQQLKQWLHANWPPGEPRYLRTTDQESRRLVHKRSPKIAEEWDRTKLESSVKRAANGRDAAVANELAKRCAEYVLDRLGGQSIVTSEQISCEAMRFLRTDEPLAYLRYASATKRFRFAREFLVEIEDLENGDERS